MQRGITWLPIIFIIAALLVGGVVGYYVGSAADKNDTGESLQNSSTGTDQTVSKLACTQDSDCVLQACEGCVAQSWLDTGPFLLQCAFYAGSTCSCEDGLCVTDSK